MDMNLKWLVRGRLLRRVRSNMTKFIKNKSGQILTVGLLMPLVLPVAPVLVSAATTEQGAVESSVSNVQATYDERLAVVPAEQVSIKIAPSERQLKQAAALERAKASIQPASVSVDASPEEKLVLIKKAASAYGIDWTVLAAVWQVESGQRWYSNIRSGAGATGPCQFMPGTWRSYAQDGNGDGKQDIADARDCLFGAAKLLAVNGGNSGRMSEALLRYNHSSRYVQMVIRIAESFQTR